MDIDEHAVHDSAWQSRMQPKSAPTPTALDCVLFKLCREAHGEMTDKLRLELHQEVEARSTVRTSNIVQSPQLCAHFFVSSLAIFGN